MTPNHVVSTQGTFAQMHGCLVSHRVSWTREFLHVVQCQHLAGSPQQRFHTDKTGRRTGKGRLEPGYQRLLRDMQKLGF